MSGVSAPPECLTQQALCLASPQRDQFIKAGILPAFKINGTIHTHFAKTQQLMKRIIGSPVVSLGT